MANIKEYKFRSPFSESNNISSIQKSIEVHASVSNELEALELLATANKILSLFTQTPHIQNEVPDQPEIVGLVLEKTYVNPSPHKRSAPRFQSTMTLQADDSLASLASRLRNEKIFPEQCEVEMYLQ